MVSQWSICMHGRQGCTKLAVPLPDSSMVATWLLLIHPALRKLFFKSQIEILPTLSSRPCKQVALCYLFSSISLLLFSLVGLYPRPYIFLSSPLPAPPFSHAQGFYLFPKPKPKVSSLILFTVNDDTDHHRAITSAVRAIFRFHPQP